MTPEFKFNLGSVLKDTITGYTGIAIGVTLWQYGCTRYGLQTQKLHEGKPVAPQWFDEPQLELVSAAPSVAEPKRHGPKPDPIYF